MANYTTSEDIIDAALFAANEPTDGTSDYHLQAVAYLNRTYQAIWMGGGELESTINEEWEWLKSTTPGVLTLNPVISTGTVAVLNNNTAITFSGNITPSLAGRFFRVTGHPDLFRISTHTSGTSAAVLDSVYTGSNNATATYKAMQLEYSLSSDVLRPLGPMRVYRDNRGEIDGVDLKTLERDWPLWNLQGGTPTNYAHVADQTVRFSHYGSETANDYMRVDFDYLKKPADLTDGPGSIPVMPLQWRKVLADFVTFRIMLDKNDTRADSYGLMGRGGLHAMRDENRHRLVTSGREAGHISPRQGGLPSHMSPRRTSSGLIIG